MRRPCFGPSGAAASPMPGWRSQGTPPTGGAPARAAHRSALSCCGASRRSARHALATDAPGLPARPCPTCPCSSRLVLLVHRVDHRLASLGFACRARRLLRVEPCPLGFRLGAVLRLLGVFGHPLRDDAVLVALDLE